MKKLEGKTVFITGGLSGIGLACALLAGQEGAKLAIADKKKEWNQNAIEVIKKENHDALFLECDVADYNAVHIAVEKVIWFFGAMDVALNNAGIGGKPNKIGEMPEKDWLKVININLNGMYNCMTHELAYMAKQHKGTIVNMSSVLGKVGYAGSGAYVAAKHGIIGLTETAAVEYATQGIRVNVICPAFIDTPLLARAGLATHPEIKKQMESLHPMNRLGTSDEVAAAFIFLASNDSTFMTGTSLVVDGGYLAV